MLAPWKKGYDQPRQHIKKQRRTKVRLVKAMVFPVVIYACENWTIKKSESEVTQSCPTLCNPMTMGFSRQEDWSGLPFPSPEDHPDTGTEPRSPTLQADTLLSEPPPSNTQEVAEWDMNPGNMTSELLLPSTREDWG